MEKVKEDKTTIIPFQLNTNTNTTTKKWKVWENINFCPFNYNINTITIKEWKVIKITFLNVIANPSMMQKLWKHTWQQLWFAKIHEHKEWPIEPTYTHGSFS
jgi:hypothetical protein